MFTGDATGVPGWAPLGWVARSPVWVVYNLLKAVQT